MTQELALSVILPASNEEAWLGDCLRALFASTPVSGGAEVIVVANGCRDRTAEVARDLADLAERSNWSLIVLERAEGGKIGALNAGDGMARGAVRAYLDADVVVSPELMGQLTAALQSARGAAYGSGRAIIPRPRNPLTRAYARFWKNLPFAQSVAPGYGLFAVNAEGRARWGEFPDIISDDTFVRLQFAPQERIGVSASYSWPMIEGWGALVRVRRRQDAGVTQIRQRWPQIMENEGKEPMGFSGILRRALRDPLGFAAYASVSLAVRLNRQNAQEWTRGR
ncbi:glycosyltransferase [Paracoccus seriniphilus]|uniref:Glycosyl transferase family 2 n=1 Tax=Paracoccus seriniphilus TaxID=184748 RepID=A0A239PP95_9RHOB|nr:glycosyltransferase [Paracoccus seriniphilus]WCR15033.1 glycosyltransferase [Paracoccus seriniphilus]SNT71527.1 Glycosyl transferase family 2 [Paracoccus seriniphilus]